MAPAPSRNGFSTFTAPWLSNADGFQPDSEVPSKRDCDGAGAAAVSWAGSDAGGQSRAQSANDGSASRVARVRQGRKVIVGGNRRSVVMIELPSASTLHFATTPGVKKGLPVP